MIESPSPRIVSLLPAATEIVAVLGFADNLVGRSHECDYPTGVEALPICTRARIAPIGSSREIDDAVKDALKNAMSIYEVLGDVLADVKPDIMITQDQCEVCAVALDDVRAAAACLIGASPKIVSLNPVDLAKVFQDIRNVADALGVSERADDIIRQSDSKLNQLSERVSDAKPPTVCCVEWTDPLMAAGNWVPELVSIAGGKDIFGGAGKHAPWLEPDKLYDADPDVIVFMPCGFGLERSAKEANLLLQTPEWQSLSAVKAGHVYATDGNSYFNRPGPRLIESAEILAEIFHPNLFEPTQEGTAWRRLIDLA